MPMLTTLVPGVGMGGTETGVVPGGGIRLLMLLKVGRMFAPFALAYELIKRALGVWHG